MSSLYPSKRLSTPIGEVEVAVTDSSHVHVHTYNDSSPGATTVTIRGIEYHLSLHLFRQPVIIQLSKEGSKFVTGYFTPENPEHADKLNSHFLNWDNLHLTRPYTGAKTDGDHASTSAREKCLQSVLPAVNQWLESPEGKEACQKADAKKLERTKDKLQTQYNKLMDEAIKVAQAYYELTGNAIE